MAPEISTGIVRKSGPIHNPGAHALPNFPTKWVCTIFPPTIHRVTHLMQPIESDRSHIALRGFFVFWSRGSERLLDGRRRSVGGQSASARRSVSVGSAVGRRSDGSRSAVVGRRSVVGRSVGGRSAVCRRSVGRARAHFGTAFAAFLASTFLHSFFAMNLQARGSKFMPKNRVKKWKEAKKQLTTGLA